MALLTCADGTGSAYTIGTRLAEPRTVERQRVAPALDLEAHLLQRTEHAAHRPAAE